jgi:hypothetical protein
MALSVFFVTACGPNAVAVCLKGCNKTIGCLGGTQGNILDCQNACQTNGGDPSVLRCANENDILSCQSSCYDVNNCTAAGTCLFGCPKCVK